MKVLKLSRLRVHMNWFDPKLVRIVTASLVMLVAFVVSPAAVHARGDFQLVAPSPEDALLSGVSLSPLEVVGGVLNFSSPIEAGAFKGTGTATGTLVGGVLSGTIVIDVRSTDNYGVETYRVSTFEFRTNTIDDLDTEVSLFIEKAIVRDNVTGQEETRENSMDQVILYSIVPIGSAGPTGDPVETSEGFIEEYSGTAYYSSASEAELEPSQRTWIPLTLKTKVYLGRGAMVRTAVGSEILLRYNTGAVQRLKESSLFAIKAPSNRDTDWSGILGRMYEGYSEFWNRGTNPNLEIETDRGITSIKGTVWQIAVDEKSTRVSVFEGSVVFTVLATGEEIDVETGQSLTVDDEGVSRASNEELGLVEPVDPDLVVAGGSDEGGNMLVPVAIAIVVLGGVVAAGFVVRRRRQTEI